MADNLLKSTRAEHYAASYKTIEKTTATAVLPFFFTFFVTAMAVIFESVPRHQF